MIHKMTLPTRYLQVCRKGDTKDDIVARDDEVEFVAYVIYDSDFQPFTCDYIPLAYISPVMSVRESISLEETNKIRISLGLKPLTDKKAVTKEDEAENNYAKRRERETKDREAKCVHPTAH